MLVEKTPSHQSMQYVLRERRSTIWYFVDAPGLRSRQAPPRCPRSLLSKSWRPATVSLARALPCPELQRCSRYSQTYSSNRLRCLGRMRWLSLRNPRKRSMALVYLCLVAGCTVKSRSVPKRCLCCALADCVAPSKCRLGMPKFAFDPDPHLLGRSAGFWSVCT